MLYSMADLQKVLGQKVLAQGEACLEEALVDSPDVMRDGELVTSLVRHPGKKPIRCGKSCRSQPDEIDGH